MVAWWSAAACLCIGIACSCWRRPDPEGVLVRRLAVGFALAALLCQCLVGMQLWHGGRLYPVPSAAADLSYYQRVHWRLSELEHSPSLSSQQSEVIAGLRRNLLQWTAFEIVDSPDVASQRAALAALTRDIDFDSVDGDVAAVYLASERTAIEQRQISLNAEIAFTEQQRDEVGGRFAAVAKLNRDDAEAVEQKRQLASELTAVETKWQQLRRDLRRLKDRQQWRQQMTQAAVGLNDQYSWLRLPVVVSGGVLSGWVWWLAYCGCSLLALLATIGLLANSLPKHRATFVLVMGLYGALWWLAVR